MEKLIIKWKHWYWYFLLAFNVFIPGFLALNRILVSKSVIQDSNSGPLLFLIITPTVLISFFLTYVFKALQEANACKVIIKPSRFKYFQRGLISSFVSFNLYIIALLVAYKDQGTPSEVVAYLSLGICCILGTVSSCFLTMYEFCVNFDIFYNKNKETIIKNYLEYSKNKIKDNK